MELSGTFLMLVLGLAVGSFLNVVIYRLPRETSIVSPPSHCPGCERRLKPLDMLPVISFIAFRGRCRYCSAPIGWRYPAVEALTAVVFIDTFLVTGWSFLLVKYLFVASLLLAIAFIDLEHYIIPDSLNVVLAAGGVVLTLLAGDVTLVQVFIGAVVVGGTLLLLGLLFQGGMGGGDIKLGAALGLTLGWPLAPLGLLLGSLVGGITGFILMAAGLKGRRDAIPFGPFLALGTFLAILWGERIIQWYVGIYL